MDSQPPSQANPPQATQPPRRQPQTNPPQQPNPNDSLPRPSRATTTNNPRLKPLHNLRQIRNAQRAAAQFPRLAAPLFTPTDALNAQPAYTHDARWTRLRKRGGLHNTSLAPGAPPQPGMTRFFRERTGVLNARPFAGVQEQNAYRAQNPHPGFVPWVTSGINQYRRIVAAGLQPRVAPAPEELARRAAHEARVQRCREGISVQTILDESRWGVEGVKREGTAPWPVWGVMQRRAKMVQDEKIMKHEKEIKAKAREARKAMGVQAGQEEE